MAKIVDTVLDWLEDRTGLVKPFLHIMLHPVPGKSTWAYVFGTAIMTALIVQLASGVALTTMYVPSGGEAWESVKWITEKVPFGSWLRATHYFGASAMIIFVGAHAIQTYLFGAFKFPRELNWISGVFLLFLTVSIGFTGQVLRWDQTAVWTIAVGAEQALRAPFVGKTLVRVLLSGDNVNASSLSHFFAMHVFVFPALLLALIGFHVWLVLHHGISEPPVAGKPVNRDTYRKEYQELLKREGKPFWPDAAWRDAVFSAIVVLGICACALYFGPPAIENPPDPSLVNAEPKPDWYLTWYFALLALVPAGIEDWFILLFPVFLVVGLLLPPFISNTGERSARRRPWAVAIVVIVVGSVLALWREGINEYWTPKFEAKPLPKHDIGATKGVIYDGGQVFNDRGCLFCHMIDGHGGKRGPDLSDVGERLTHDQLTIRIINGGVNMPAYAGNITPEELESVTKFLQSRRPHGIPLDPSSTGAKDPVNSLKNPELVPKEQGGAANQPFSGQQMPSVDALKEAGDAHHDHHDHDHDHDHQDHHDANLGAPGASGATGGASVSPGAVNTPSATSAPATPAAAAEQSSGSKEGTKEAAKDIKDSTYAGGPKNQSTEVNAPVSPTK